MQTTIKFNTERQYSAKGQRIAARLMPNGSTVFVDVDRNIEGVIPVLCDVELTELLFDRVYVLDAYDGNHYAMPYGEHDETIRELRALFNPEPAPAAPAAPVQAELDFAAPAETKDYSVTVQDKQGRIAVLAINGASVDECVATGLSLAEVCEQLETNAFWLAIREGEIDDSAVLIDTTDRPL
jgi:hypothetical protein